MITLRTNSDETLPREYNRKKGGEVMIPEITDKNLYLLLPGKVAAVVEQYVEDNGVSILDGLRKFYNSSTYRKLEKEQTKLWHLGPVALYQEFQENF